MPFCDFMDDALVQFADNLEDIAALRLGRFAQAHEAERLAIAVLQSHPHVSAVDVCGIVEAWSNKHRPAVLGGPIAADLHCRLALVESIWYWSRGGS